MLHMWMSVHLTSSMPQQKFKLQISLNYGNILTKSVFCVIDSHSSFDMVQAHTVLHK